MDDAAILKRMREAIASSRGYASFFGWAPNRDLEELGPVRELAEASAARGVPLFDSIRIRGRGNDPPDLEALDPAGARVAIEVTELVDGDAIKAFKAGRHYDWAEWNRPKFLAEMEQRLAAKVARQSKLKDPPYEGGYVVVVFTDEPMQTERQSRDTLTATDLLRSRKESEPTCCSRMTPRLSRTPTMRCTLRPNKSLERSREP